jgi:hypothetical protein
MNEVPVISDKNENPYASPLADSALPDRPVLASPEAVPCPRCGSTDVGPVPYDPMVGRHGPRAIDHIRCNACRTEYNGETGREIKSKFLRQFLPFLIAGILFLFYLGLMLFSRI